MSGKNGATFSIGLENQVSGPAKEAAESLKGFRDRILQGQESIKAMSADMRRLRGDSEEVKAAKKTLSEQIKAEQAALTSAQLAISKAGVTMADLTKKTEKAAESTEKATDATTSVKEAFAAVGGPLATVSERAEGLATKFGSVKSLAGALAVGVAALAAVAWKLASAFAAATSDLARFVIASADAARSANLLREAATGSAANASALGTQVSDLADRLATPKAKLNELAVGLAKAGLQGKTLVDTFNATAQAAEAMGDDVGSTIADIVKRGQLMQRMQISPLELRGKGLGPQAFEEIADELAKATGKGVKDARAALFEGRVPLQQGAEALRKALEKKFGDINLRKSLSLEAQATKLRERLAALTSGVNIEPLLAGFGRLSKLFDDSTVTGAALKKLVTDFGDGMVQVFASAEPLVRGFVKGLVIGALNIESAWLSLRLALAKAIGRDIFATAIDETTAFKVAVTAGKVAAYGFAAAIAAVGTAATLAAAPLLALGATVAAAWAAMGKAGEWAKAGASIVDGIIDGIKSRIAALEKSVTDMARGIQKRFASVLEIRSPSRVMRKLGEHVPEGTAGGIEAKADAPARAAARMGAGVASGAAGGLASGAGGGVSVNVTINVEGAAALGKSVEEDFFVARLKAELQKILAGGFGTAPAT